MAYSVIYQLLSSTDNANSPVSIGLLRRVLEEILLALPAYPAKLDSGSNVPT